MLSLAAGAEPAAADTSFREIGVQRGLEGRAITDVLVDRDGFVWTASREGLYRYDGYRAERFLPDATDPHAISDSDLRALYQGSDGSIWVSANTGGLNRLDPRSGRFEVFRHDPDDPGSLSYDSVYSVVEDRAGDLWVGTQFGLNRLDRATGRFTRFRHEPDNPGSLAHDYVFDVALARDGSVWAATVGGGLSRWRAEAGRFERFDLAAVTGDARHNDVFAVIEGDDGHVWAGTRGGLLRLEPETGEVRSADADGPDESPVITTLAAGPDGRLWMGTLAQGVLIFDPAGWRTTQANPAALGSEGQLPALPQLRIAFLGERLLVGTWGGGLFLGSRAEAAFRLIEAGEDGLRYHDVTAVYHHPAEATLWIGTFGGGLQGFDPDGRQFLAAPSEAPLFSTAGIMSIARTADGTLFAGDTAGLWEVQLPDRIRLHRAESGRGGSLGAGYVTALLARGDELWVGTGGSGLFRMNTGDSGLARFESPAAGAAGESYPGDFITALLAPGGGTLWVGTRSNGLSVCRPAPWSCPQRLATNGAGPTLSHDNVTFLFQDSSDRIWIGTDGGGLHQALLDDRGFVSSLRRWQESDGLVSAGVLGMVEDDDGSLWILTRHGLSRMDPAGSRFVNYTEHNGLAVVSFNARAAARDTGRLYFGALGGLVEVAAGLPFPEQPPSPLAITHLRSAGIDAGTGAGGAPIGSPTGRARFAYGEPVSLQFAVLDYAETPHEYEYRSAGAADWLPLGSRRDLTLFGLAPGQHAFEIRGRDRLGQWSDPTRVAIDVVPPFWMTGWFRTLLLVLLGALLLGAHVVRTRRLQDRYLELQKLQAQREAALRETERRRQELDEAYQGLVHLTRRLESVKEDERQHIARELHDQFGQNLTASKIDLQVLRQQLTEPAFQARVGQALANLDDMITQVRSLSLRLRPPLLEEVGLVAALEHFVVDLEERSGLAIDFVAAADIASTSGPASSVVFRIAQEAVNNALRHARAHRIAVSLSERDGGLELVVRDDGVGFDPDAARRSAATGEHLGLLGMAERVRAAGGALEIEAAPGQGCRIIAWVPQ